MEAMPNTASADSANAVENVTAYNVWVNAQRQPGDAADADGGAARALARRVKTHLFVMSGGEIISKSKDGVVTYGDPIDPEKIGADADCPWHGVGCSAWEAIKAGAVPLTFDGPTLRELRSRTPEEIAEAKKMAEVERIAHDHNVGRDLAKRVSDSEDAFQQKRAAARERFAGSRDRYAEMVAEKPKEAGATFTGSQHRSAEPGKSGHQSAADTLREGAAADLKDAAESLGDEIIIDGDEDEPDEVSGNREEAK